MVSPRALHRVPGWLSGAAGLRAQLTVVSHTQSGPAWAPTLGVLLHKPTVPGGGLGCRLWVQERRGVAAAAFLAVRRGPSCPGQCSPVRSCGWR